MNERPVTTPQTSDIVTVEHLPLVQLLRQRRRALIETMRTHAEETGLVEVGHIEMLATTRLALEAIAAVEAEGGLMLRQALAAKAKPA